MNKLGIVQVLKQQGYGHHLINKLGGNRKDLDAYTSLRINADFLEWSYYHVYRSYATDGPAVLGWLAKIIRRRYQLLSAFTDHLTTERRLKAPTIRNYAMEISKCCTWFVLFYSGGTRLGPASLAGIQQVTRAVCTAARRADKKARCEDERSSMAAQVLLRRMPAGGIDALQDAVLKELPWVRDLENKTIDRDSYNRFMGIMYAALYAFSAQGRQSGVMDMKYHQLQDLLHDGYANSTKFKTAQAFQYQSVTSSGTFDFLLRIYAMHVRTCVVPLEENPAAPLFLTYHGQPEDRLGKRLTTFFKRTMELHVTTTAIRSLVETMTDKMYIKGKITKEGKESVQHINGHSSRITQDYYVRRDQANMVAQARDVFSTPGTHAHPHLCEKDLPHVQVLPRSPESAEEVRGWAQHQGCASAGWARNDRLEAANWGTAHPDYQSGGKKARWTTEEVQYIRRWCEHDHGGYMYSTNIVARCLAHILSDRAALPIFHPNHVLDSARLRHGYRTYMKTRSNKGQHGTEV
jgi:hypothetical protein